MERRRRPSREAAACGSWPATLAHPATRAAQCGAVKLGVVFPQTESGNDRAVIRDYATSVEGAGYDFLVAFDHVLGANPDRPGGWAGPYTHRTPFHEVFVLFGFIAALTSRLELATEV